jgi:hypothetical protein
LLKQTVEHSIIATNALAQFGEKLEIRFQAEAQQCNYCMQQLNVYKTHRRTVFTLSYGCFIACEILLFCSEHKYGVTTSDCSSGLPIKVLKYRSKALKQLVAPRASFAYDVVDYIGQARFIRHRQRQEIQAELLSKGIEISTGEISNLCDLFLVYIEQLHIKHADRLRELMIKSGGYVLHIDATGENGSEMLLVCYDGLQNIALYATKIKSEVAEEISAAIQQTIELFGLPLAIIHDLGSGMSKAAQALKDHLSEIVDLICEFHFLQDIGKDIIESDYDILRKIFRKSQISPRLRRLEKRIAIELKDQNHAVNYFYNAFDQGRFQLDHLDINRALIYAMISWILDYKCESNGLGFPFEQPYVTFFNRCHRIRTMVKKLLKNKYFEDEIIRDYLLKIKHIVDKIHDDKRFKSQINCIRENLTLFNELRNTLRLFNDKSHGLNSCRTFHSRQEINDVQQQLTQFKQSIQKRLLNEKLTNTTKRAIKIILKHLEKYQHHLFGRIFEVEIDGLKKLIIADRTNNCLEQFFRNIKRFLRRTTGRKNLKRNLNELPSQVALTANLQNEDYITTVYGSLDNLPVLFSQLDQKNCKEQLKLLRLKRSGDIMETRPIIKNKDFIEQTVKIYQNALAEVVFLDKKELSNPTVI